MFFSIFIVIGIYVFYTLDSMSWKETIFILSVAILAEMVVLLYWWFPNRKKKNYVTVEDETIVIFKNNRKVEYPFSKAKLSTLIPNCMETISFGENYSISAESFKPKEFAYIKEKLFSVPRSHDNIQLDQSKKCEKVLPIYKISLIIISILIFLYVPFFDWFEKILIVFVAIFIFEAIYSHGKRRGDDGCIQATVIAYIVIIATLLYQVFFNFFKLF